MSCLKNIKVRFGEKLASWNCTYEDVRERKDFQILHLGGYENFPEIES